MIYTFYIYTEDFCIFFQCLSLTHLKCIFTFSVTQRSNFIFFHTDNQLAKHHLLSQHCLFSSSLYLHSVQVCWSVCLLLGQQQILISKSFIFLPDQVSAPPFLALYSFFKSMLVVLHIYFCSHTLGNQLVEVPWKSCGNFERDFTEGRNDILRMSFLPICEHGICLHLISLICLVWFLMPFNKGWSILS